MYKSLIAAALMASAVSADSSIAPGKAIVVNGCQYEVYMQNTPAANGGYENIEKTLAPNETYEQTFTELTNKMGWSIKLSKNTAFQTNILQYEYTYLHQDNIWFDLSAVDGNPWDSNWEVSAKGGNGCTPRHAAYRYSTDDSYGMQDCQADADITVLLCAGEEQNDGIASSVSLSMIDSSTAAPAASSEAPSSVYSEPASTTAPVAVHHNQQVEVTSATPTPTTFAVITSPHYGVTVTEVATVVVTEFATATHYAHKRHEDAHHHARHPHARK